MSQKFYEMQAEVVGVKAGQPPETTLYLVAAYHGNDKRWSIRREQSHQEYTTFEAAAEAASKLAGHWTHARIVKISLGPEQGDA